MERSGFFDANLVGEEFDRVYLASQFAAYFSSFIGNGVFGGKADELQVTSTATPSMQVQVLDGQGYIDGYWYENTDMLFLPIDISDGVLNRIDSVVLRLGFSERAMWIAVKKGVSATTPTQPSLTRNADYYELQLATIRINAGAISIKPADITDTRLDPAVCGLVVGLIQQLDTTEFGYQLQNFIDDYIEKADADFADYLIWLDNLKDSSVDEVQDLLDQLSGLIDTDVAGNLQNQITALDSRVTDVESFGLGDLSEVTEVANTDTFLIDKGNQSNKLTYTTLYTKIYAQALADIRNEMFIVDESNYGTSLPTAGTAGRVFFKRV